MLPSPLRQGEITHDAFNCDSFDLLPFDEFVRKDEIDELYLINPSIAAQRIPSFRGYHPSLSSTDLMISWASSYRGFVRWSNFAALH